MSPASMPKVIASSVAALAIVLATLVTSAPAEARRGTTACGPRGCAHHGASHRPAARAAARPGYPAARPGTRPVAGPGTRPVARPGYRPGTVNRAVVVNPRRYWAPGGAIAAGAAIGFVSGAAAVSIAGSPPQPGYCWYYVDSSRTKGFWDVCPR